MSQSFTNLLYHLIFSTKDRRPLIALDYPPRLYDYIGGTIRGTGGISLGINGVEDHVLHHLFVLDPRVPLAKPRSTLGFMLSPASRAARHRLSLFPLRALLPDNEQLRPRHS